MFDAYDECHSLGAHEKRFDLYSKSDAVPDCKALWPYYKGLLKKYNLDGVLRW